MKNTLLLIAALIGLTLSYGKAQNHVIWQIGEADNSSAEFALSPNEYKRFLEKDFGWEDKYFLIGSSSSKEDWPYVIPGPADQWGGTWSTSGWRSHTLNILFGIEKLPKEGEWLLIVDIQDINAKESPVFKISINDKSWKYELPLGSGNNTLEGNSTEAMEKKVEVHVPENGLKKSGNVEPTGSENNTTEDKSGEAMGHIIEIPIPDNVLKSGGNKISMTTIQGSWLLFDQIRLEGPEDAKLKENGNVFLRKVKVANYEIEHESDKAQPLLVDVEHLSGTPELSVVLDGKNIFTETIETGRYVFEAPMPAVSSAQKSTYKILIDGQEIQSGKVERSPQKLITPADYADTKMGTAHSRWMIAPGPWMPFSMVKLSPDNQNGGWQAGYDPIFETLGGFSHIHEWTMGGLSLMPTKWQADYRSGRSEKT